MSRAERAAWHDRGAFFCVAGLLLTVPFVFVPTAAESFRAPKLWASGLWGLASLIFLAAGLHRRERLSPAALWQLPALRSTLPLLGLALLSLLTTQYPASVASASAELAIGAACLVGWSLGLAPDRRDKLRTLVAWPAALLSLLAILQLSGIYRPFAMRGGEEVSRMGVTSLAGNAGDLATYLVLPALLLQARLLDGRGRRRIWTASLLALTIAGLAATQTLTALGALVLGSLAFWLQRLPRRRVAPVLATTVGVALVLVLAVPPLRSRAQSKLASLRAGDWGQFLTYRLDGWRAATWMLGEHPLAGVGHGAYRSSYAGARLALAESGRDYSGEYRQLSFFNAHNDVLEVGAELGWPGLVALGFAAWTLIQGLRRVAPARRPLAIAGALSLAVLAIAGFPF